MRWPPFHPRAREEFDEVFDLLAERTPVLARGFLKSTMTTIELQANRADGLVISEYSFTATVQGQPGFGYVFFGYLEVYNNVPETIFLDGSIVAKGFPHGVHDFDVRPCDQTRQGANDPEGVWGRWFQQFPGSGVEFPLSPGRRR